MVEFAPMQENGSGRLDDDAGVGGKGKVDDLYRMQVARRLLESRGPGCIHLLTGLRGSGKTRMVRDLLKTLEQQGEQTRYWSLEEPEFRWIRNGCDFFISVKNLLSSVKGSILLVLDEPAAIPYMSAAIGSLATDGGFELLVVSSTASILSAEERSYFAGRFNQEELLPTAESRRCPWFELLVKDVLKEPGVPDIHILERVAEYLAATVGKEHTQREMVDFAEWDRAISKNTPARCVSALCNAHVIRTVPKFNLFEGARSQKGGLKYCFTDPEMRQQTFGRLSPAAELFEATVVRLARQGEVCWVDDAPGVVDFVTLRGNGVTGCWRVTPEGPVVVPDMELGFSFRAD